jgi:3-deoxy-D-manno-octulosonate 8-phosphate phosphatase (KDO 8-P phosphatase)
MSALEGSALTKRAAAVRLLVLDVDGVLTDGRITYTADGIEIKSFHVRDGSAVKLWERLGGRVAIISGRTSKAVDVRAAELGIAWVVQGASDKSAAFGRVLDTAGVTAAETCAVGDDLPDLPLLRECGLGVAVADACPEARAAAGYVTHTRGGHGVVREVVELLLRAQGRWAEAVGD